MDAVERAMRVVSHVLLPVLVVVVSVLGLHRVGTAPSTRAAPTGWVQTAGRWDSASQVCARRCVWIAYVQFTDTNGQTDVLTLRSRSQPPTNVKVAYNPHNTSQAESLWLEHPDHAQQAPTMIVLIGLALVVMAVELRRYLRARKWGAAPPSAPPRVIRLPRPTGETPIDIRLALALRSLRRGSPAVLLAGGVLVTVWLVNGHWHGEWLWAMVLALLVAGARWFLRAPAHSPGATHPAQPANPYFTVRDDGTVHWTSGRSDDMPAHPEGSQGAG